MNNGTPCLALEAIKLAVIPGAEGDGIYTPAGRGGQIIKVTNLDDDGPGSLRDAIETAGPRIVVFEVAGSIELTKPIVIANPFVTVSGQTAPAPGVTINGYGLQISTHDVLVQHLFIRITSRDGDDGVRIYCGSKKSPQIYNIVIDHVSASWGNDENVSVVTGSGHDITISNCIIGEGHYGLLIDSDNRNISLVGNLIMSARQRHPLIKGGGNARLINNIFYNAGNQSFAQIGSGGGASRVSFAGNLFIDGPNTRPNSNGIQVYNAAPGTQIYAPETGAHGNRATHRVLSPAALLFLVDSPPVSASLERYTVVPVDFMESHIIRNAGARPGERKSPAGDSVDKRLLSEFQSRTGSVKDRDKPQWIKPLYTSRTFRGPDDPGGDSNGDGYTNIEELLHKMAKDVER